MVLRMTFQLPEFRRAPTSTRLGDLRILKAIKWFEKALD